MATFRSILSRRIFAVAVGGVGFVSLGAVFAPLTPSFQVSSDPMCVGLSMDLKIVSGLAEVEPSSHRDAALARLEELILTHRAISVSA